MVLSQSVLTISTINKARWFQARQEMVWSLPVTLSHLFFIPSGRGTGEGVGGKGVQCKIKTQQKRLKNG